MKPVEGTKYREKFDDDTVRLVVEQSGGYPYFIQFICREIYDAFTQKEGLKSNVPIDAIIQKLDSDFFAGRWSRATDRERELMIILAESGKPEFTLQEAAILSEQSSYNDFSSSLISQFFGKLIDKGLIYKDRRGVYLFAVPLLAQYILRVEKTRASEI